MTILYEGEPATDFGPDGDEPAKFLVFAPLVAWNRDSELEPRLAEEWEHSSDFRTWTIRLRDGVRWHDGVPVSAHDMKFTLDLLQHPDTLIFMPGGYAVTVLDDRTYRIVYERQPFTNEGGALDDDIACWPKHRLEHLDPKQILTWNFWAHPVGCGPYRHVRTVPQTMMEFEANPDYFRGRPRIERVILKFAGWNAGSAMPELLSGSVDATASWYPPDLANIRPHRGFRVYQQQMLFGSAALWWNTRDALFEDPIVRRALTLAINRRELMQFSNLPPEAPLSDFLLTQQQLQRGGYPPPLPYEPNLAGQLLDQTGWLRRRRQGTRERNGRSFRFTALVPGITNGGDTAVYVQDQLKRIGIRMDITIMSDDVASRIKSGDFQAAHLYFGRVEMESNLRGAGYENPSFFQLLDAVRTTFDPGEKERLHLELSRMFQADVPATLLFPSMSSTIASTRIRGLEDSPYRGDLTQCMDRLWLEEQA